MHEWRLGKVAGDGMRAIAEGDPFAVLAPGYLTPPAFGCPFETVSGHLGPSLEIDWGSCVWTGHREAFLRLWAALGRDGAEISYMEVGVEYGLVFIELG